MLGIIPEINFDGYFNDYLDRGLMTPDEYTEYICRMDEIFHKGGTVRIYSQDGTIKEKEVEKNFRYLHCSTIIKPVISSGT